MSRFEDLRALLANKHGVQAPPDFAIHTALEFLCNELDRLETRIFPDVNPRALTAGRLRKALAAVPDDTPVIVQVWLDEIEDWDGSVVSTRYVSSDEVLRREPTTSNSNGRFYLESEQS